MEFVVAPKGVGLVDYGTRIERSTAPIVTPFLRQRSAILEWSGNIPTPAWPNRYRIAFGLPQEDGTDDWPASTITLHFVDFEVAARTRRLVATGLVRYNSLDDFYADIAAERYPEMYGYGAVHLKYSKGIATRPGSVYAMLVGFWSDRSLEYMTFTFNAIMTNLTEPYRVWR